MEEILSLDDGKIVFSALDVKDTFGEWTLMRKAASRPSPSCDRSCRSSTIIVARFVGRFSVQKYDDPHGWALVGDDPIIRTEKGARKLLYYTQCTLGRAPARGPGLEQAF